jgi:DNA-binding MltR family transcriptional regulator
MAKKKDDTKNQTALEINAEVISAMNQEFNDSPDRVLAIVGAAYLDSLLEALFRTIFVTEKEEADLLLGPDKALGSNGAKYQLAYCLGLIEKDQFNDLKMIARIRNTFAHKYNVRSFDHEEPSKFIAKLNYGKELDLIIKDLIQNTRDPEQQNHLRKIGASGRRKFQDTVRNLLISMMQRLNSAVRQSKATWYQGNPL